MEKTFFFVKKKEEGGETGSKFLKKFKKHSRHKRVRSRLGRVGGANYQVPREVRPERRLYLGMKWVIEAAKAKKGKPMAEKLAEEIILASKNEGEAIRKRENTHKMAEANKAFAHFACYFLLR